LGGGPCSNKKGNLSHWGMCGTMIIGKKKDIKGGEGKNSVGGKT